MEHNKSTEWFLTSLTLDKVPQTKITKHVAYRPWTCDNKKVKESLQGTCVVFICDGPETGEQPWTVQGTGSGDPAV
jgi:hypothetical protein